ncbi:MAG: NADH-quinone oxidoreductase subunit M [Chlorobi bacterium]|nr:NADH-quinone oxidoreductase subunit M [Chlorobiota bacterium]MCI0714705.1 NADH-quinone oxidoreductase subunit M [Chlorobiota bacterium]
MNNILTVLIFSPIVLSIPVLFFRDKEKLIKIYSFIVSAAVFGFSLYVLSLFNSANADFQFVERYQWVKDFNIFYLLGIDGISLLLVLLTAFIFPVTILGVWGSVATRVKEFYFLLLLLEGALLGVFLSLDLILFYVFWELILIPMYFIIGFWGGKNKYYANLKFFLYTMFGSLLMLVAIIWLSNYVTPQLGKFTTDYLELRKVSPYTPQTIQLWLFIFFGLSFVIKVPMFPFHTWLPDAHTEAPTAGSIILAAVLLKMGTYGIIRFSMELFPIMFIKYAWLLAVFGVIGIIYGALVCIAQKDVKKLVAYSSVSHMGFILLGLAALNVEAMQGALIQMVNHGLSTGALFMFVGFLYDRRYTREIADYGGILKVVPIFGSLLLVICLSSIGLPGLNGFIGEFMILIGSFNSALLNNHTYTILGTTGVVLSAVYLLWMYQRVLLGPLDKDINKSIPDLNLRETVASALIIIFIVWIGVYPNTFLSKSEASMKKVIENVETAKRNLLRIP